MTDKVFQNADTLKEFLDSEMRKLSPEEKKTITLMNIICVNMMATSHALTKFGVNKAIVDGITASSLKHAITTLLKNGYEHEAETLALFAHSEAQGIETVEDFLQYIIDMDKKEDK